jgi:broad specificity phosphatase PhoE
MQWINVKKILKQHNNTFNDALSVNGETLEAFNDRILDFYKDMIMHSIVSPTVATFPDLSESFKSVLIVTHGGWIKHMFDHLINELKFTFPETQRETITHFPKNGSIYEFQIIQTETEFDFEWHGHISLVNDVSYQSKMWKKMAVNYNPSTDSASPKLLRKVRQIQNAEKKHMDIDIQDPNPIDRKRSLGW